MFLYINIQIWNEYTVKSTKQVSFNICLYKTLCGDSHSE